MDTVDAGKSPAPEILAAPEPVAVKEGETIRLTCKVKGKSHLTMLLTLMNRIENELISMSNNCVLLLF